MTPYDSYAAKPNDCAGHRTSEIDRLGQAMPWWVGLKAFAMVMLWLFPAWVIIALAIWLAWF